MNERTEVTAGASFIRQLQINILRPKPLAKTTALSIQRKRVTTRRSSKIAIPKRLWRKPFNATTDCCENGFHNNPLYGSTCCGISVSGFDVFCNRLLATTFGCVDRGVFGDCDACLQIEHLQQSSRTRLVGSVAEIVDCPGLQALVLSASSMTLGIAPHSSSRLCR